MARRVLFCALLLALVSALAPVTAMGEELLPFKGHFEGYIEHTAGGDCGSYPPMLAATLVGSGNATHMGQFQVTGGHCLNALTGAVLSGHFNVTTASGDLLYADYEGRIIDPNPVRTVIEISGNFNGGTGRFTGATGPFTGIGVRTNGTIWHSDLTFDARGSIVIPEDQGETE